MISIIAEANFEGYSAVSALIKDPSSTAVNDKERMDEIFAKKQIGRPAGTWENKREQYLQMLNKGKISQPKPATLEYYKIVKLDGEYMMEAVSTKKGE